MRKTFEKINRVLADWNPINVPENIAIDEYKSYVPLILRSIEDRQQLMKCLEDILVNKLRIEYNPENKEHLKDLKQFCDRLIRVYEKSKTIE